MSSNTVYRGGHLYRRSNGQEVFMPLGATRNGASEAYGSLQYLGRAMRPLGWGADGQEPKAVLLDPEPTAVVSTFLRGHYRESMRLASLMTEN